MSVVIIKGDATTLKEATISSLIGELERRGINYDKERKEEKIYLFRLLSEDDFSRGYLGEELDLHNKFIVMNTEGRFEMVDALTGNKNIFMGGKNFRYDEIADFQPVEGERKLIIRFDDNRLIVYSSYDGEIYREYPKPLDRDTKFLYMGNNLVFLYIRSKSYKLWNIEDNTVSDDRIINDKRNEVVIFNSKKIDYHTVLIYSWRELFLIDIDNKSIIHYQYSSDKRIAPKYNKISSTYLLDIVTDHDIYMENILYANNYIYFTIGVDGDLLKYNKKTNTLMKEYDMTVKSENFIYYDVGRDTIYFIGNNNIDIIVYKLGEEDSKMAKREVYKISFTEELVHPIRVTTLSIEVRNKAKQMINKYINNNIANLISKFI